MLERRASVCLGAAAALALAAAPAARGAVSLTFTNSTATSATTTASPGSMFGFSVFLNESATTDDVSGLDYRLQVSSAGSGDFRLSSRTSSSAFTPEAADSSPSVAPVTFSPTNGATDLGADRNGAADLNGVSSTKVADYNVLILAGAPLGTYTFSFLGTGSLALPTYSGGPPSYPTQQFASENSFTVTVAAPEPTSWVTVAGSTAALVTLVRRPRRAGAGAAAV